MKTFTIEQIRKYLQQVDSLDDALYKLSEENIDKANNKSNEDQESLYNCEHYQHDSCICMDKCHYGEKL